MDIVKVKIRICDILVKAIIGYIRDDKVKKPITKYADEILALTEDKGMMSENGLLPCPFCDEKEQLQVQKIDFKNEQRDIIKCRICRGEAPRKYWNRGKIPSNPSGDINCEEAEKFHKKLEQRRGEWCECEFPNIFLPISKFKEGTQYCSKCEKPIKPLPKTCVESHEHTFIYIKENERYICTKCGLKLPTPPKGLPEKLDYERIKNNIKKCHLKKELLEQIIIDNQNAIIDYLAERDNKGKEV